MTFFGSLNFYLVLGVILVPHIVMGILEKRQKFVVLITSIIMISLVFKNHRAEYLSLILYLIYEFIIVLGFFKIKQRQNITPIFYKVTLFLSMLPVIVVKLPFSVPYLSYFGFLGISYITFRTIQVIIEIYDGIIKEMNVVDLLVFWIFFPSLSSGPIDRSRRFSNDINESLSRKEYIILLGKGLWKILLGLTYKFAFSTLFFKHLETIQIDRSLVKAVEYAYTYGFYMFFDFAGYSLLAVGTAYIMGVQLPDNFKAPFISKDMKEFWNRWHISLSHWLRDYLFTRFVFQSMKKKRFKSRQTTAALGFIFNMTVMGIWHGATIYYILYGVYHGVLLALTEIYQKKSKFHKQHKNKRWYQVLSWFITLNFVMAGFLLFSGRIIKI